MNSTPQADTPPFAARDPRQVRRAIAASVIGNGFEWFDFMAYVYFSKIIAEVFFSVGSSVVSMSLALATFASGFLVRPIGGVLLGRYADRVGRTRALSFVMLMMCAGTLLLGLAPGYATLGVAAPLLVLVARLVQGLAIGAQFSLSSVIIVETAPPGQKMFYGSFNMSSQALAVLLSSGCGYLLTTYLAPASILSWGWRVPFLLGALVGPLGFYIRHHIAEPPEFEALRKQVRNGAERVVRLRDFVREQGDAALCAMGVMIIGTASNYLWNAYLPVYVERQLHLPLKSALLGTFVGGVINFLLFPVSGKLADRFGAYRLFYPLAIGWLLCTFPLFWYIVSAPSLTRLFIAQIIASIFQVAIAGPHPGMLATIFPAKARSTGVALSYNLAVTLFGGLAPLTVATLSEVSGSHYVPAFYVAFASLVSLGLVTFTRTGQAALATDRASRKGFFQRGNHAPMVDSATTGTTET